MNLWRNCQFQILRKISSNWKDRNLRFFLTYFPGNHNCRPTPCCCSSHELWSLRWGFDPHGCRQCPAWERGSVSIGKRPEKSSKWKLIIKNRQNKCYFYRGEKSARIEWKQIVVVEKLWILAFSPFPDVQIVELSLRKLDGN